MSDVETPAQAEASAAPTAVAVRGGAQAITERARTKYDPEQARLIRQTVAKGCNDGEFAMFLEIAARYDLDVFCGEIYAAKMPSKNGGEGRVAIIVGRDGLLKVARRTGELIGISGDVVCEKDEFRKSSQDAEPEHSYGVDRGKIMGAWTTVYRVGVRPTYFFAPMNEYLPSGNRLQYTPWNNQKSAMILKCAQSLALRLAFSITGVVAEEEMGRVLEPAAAPPDMAIEWGDDPTLAAWLQDLVEAANTETPGYLRDAKLLTKLRGRSDEQRETFAAELVERLTERKVPVPDRPTAEDLEARAAAADGEIIQDAEVVDDEATTPEAEAEPEDDDTPEGPPEGYVPSDPSADIPFGSATAQEPVEGPLPGQTPLALDTDDDGS